MGISIETVPKIKEKHRIRPIFLIYRDDAASIMEQAREKFLTAFDSFGYKKGAAIGILSDILDENTRFAADTRKLFS